jgi:hypothetical protein
MHVWTRNTLGVPRGVLVSRVLATIEMVKRHGLRLGETVRETEEILGSNGTCVMKDSSLTAWCLALRMGFGMWYDRYILR